MLRVTIEVLPAGDDTLDRTLASMTIVNDGTGTATNGHYDVQLTYFERDSPIFTKTARVADFDRERHAVDLVALALSTINPVKQGMASFPDRVSEKADPRPSERVMGFANDYDESTDPVD